MIANGLPPPKGGGFLFQVKFKNPYEFLDHKDRDDGKSDLFYGKIGESEHNHSVLNNGNVNFIREDGRVKADDKFKPEGYDPFKSDDPLDLFKDK